MEGGRRGKRILRQLTCTSLGISDLSFRPPIRCACNIYVYIYIYIYIHTHIYILCVCVYIYMWYIYHIRTYIYHIQINTWEGEKDRKSQLAHGRETACGRARENERERGRARAREQKREDPVPDLNPNLNPNLNPSLNPNLNPILNPILNRRPAARGRCAKYQPPSQTLHPTPLAWGMRKCQKRPIIRQKRPTNTSIPEPC